MSKKAQINMKGLTKELAAKSKRLLLPIFNSRAQRAIARAKEQLIEDFMSHLITQELEAGPEARNTSASLGGYGNLFTYIGFEEGSDPIAPIKAYLRRAIKLRQVRMREFQFILTVELPSKEDIEALSPVPWAPGRSWVDAMERGLSGLGYYLNTSAPFSRSGHAIQAKVNVRPGSFQNQSYISPILASISKNIRKALTLTL